MLKIVAPLGWIFAGTEALDPGPAPYRRYSLANLFGSRRLGFPNRPDNAKHELISNLADCANNRESIIP